MVKRKEKCGLLDKFMSFVLVPFTEAILQGTFHPCMPTILNCFRNREPCPTPRLLFRPWVQLFLHIQSVHCSFTQSFRAKLVLVSLALELVFSHQILQVRNLQVQSSFLLTITKPICSQHQVIYSWAKLARPLQNFKRSGNIGIQKVVIKGFVLTSKIPRTPASSTASLAAASLTVSSFSHPPYKSNQMGSET